MNILENDKLNKIVEINRIARQNYLIRRTEGRTLIKHIPLELQQKRGRKPLKPEDKKPKIEKEKLKAGRKVKDISNYDSNDINLLKLTIRRPTRGRPKHNKELIENII